MIGESTITCEAPGVWRPSTAPKCQPPPKPIPTIAFSDNTTNASTVQTEEPVEEEEVKVVTEMTRLMTEKDESARNMEIVKDKENEVREVAEEHYKTDQAAIASQKEATARATELDKVAKDAVQAKIDGEALKESEELQKRKDADDAVATKMEESRKAEEEKLRASQEVAAAKRNGGGGGAEPGTPGSGMVASEPSKEEEEKSIASAEKEEGVEKIMADVAGMAQQQAIAEKSTKDAKNAADSATKELDDLEAQLSAIPATDVAGKATLQTQRDAAAQKAEEAKKKVTMSELAVETAKTELQKAVSDPKIKEARIAESQSKADTTAQDVLATETASKMAAEKIEVTRKTLDQAKTDGKDTSALQQQLLKAEADAKQTAIDLARLQKEKEMAAEELAQVKDQVDGGDVNALVQSVTKDSSVSETAGIGEDIKDNDRAKMVQQIESSTKLDEATKEAVKGALNNAQDLAQTTSIVNAAAEGADAVREAAASPTEDKTIFTMSDKIGNYIMENPGYPGRKDWEIFSVRVVGGEGLMSASSAHEACRAFPDAQLITRDIAHAGRLAGFQRCQPAWIERYGIDQPDPEDGKCRTPPESFDQSSCPEGTEEKQTEDKLECLRDCPLATAVIMAGDAGCPTNRAPPCANDGSERESNGRCMTVPGTVAESTVVMSQALCTRPVTIAPLATTATSATSLLEIEESKGDNNDATAAMIPALIVYNITTGKETNRHYDLSSEKGRSLDPKTSYILSGAMMVKPLFNYDAPVVRSVRPALGPADGGAVITITGLNFGPNDAYFGEKLQFDINEIDGKDGAPDLHKGGKGWDHCRTTTWVSDTVAKCVTPAGVGTTRQVRGHLATLTGDAGSGYNYNRPILDRLEPNHGPPRGGYQVVVHGSNFGTVRSTWVQGKSIVKIDGRDCLATAWISDAKVRCTVPPGWSKKRFVDMEEVAGQKANPKALFSYDRPIVQTVTPNIAPTEFTKGSIVLTIDGDNFGECGGVANTKTEYCPRPKAFVNGLACLDTEYVSHEQVKCTLPQGVGTNLRVTVVLGNIDSKMNGLFTYSKPTLASVNPKHGPAVGGTEVTVLGEHFGHAKNAGECTAQAKQSCRTGQCCKASNSPVIKLNDIKCQRTKWVSNTEILCTVAQKPGVGARNPISVIVGRQTTKTLNDEVRYTINPPTVASIAPQVVPRGGGVMALVNKGKQGNVWENVPAKVYITGLNFGTTTSTLQAGFDEMVCSNTKWISNTKMQCTLTTPLRDGFEDRSPWVVVGGQESYAPYPRSKSEVEYRVIGYKRHDKYIISSDHLFVAEGLSLAQCTKKCDGKPGCKGISRPFAKGDTTSSKCEGWTMKALSSCTADQDTVVHIHESVPTTEIGACHSVDTLRAGPFVGSMNKVDHFDPNGGEVVVFSGFNFGLPGSPKAATAVGFVDNFPCLATKVLSDSKLECIVPPNGASGANVLVMHETFDTYTNGRSVTMKKKDVNPMYVDIESSTGEPSSKCGSAVMPGGAWVLPSTGVRLLETKPMTIRFGGTLQFAVRVGQGGNCDAPVGATTIAGTAFEVQYTTDGMGQGMNTWRPLRRWSMDSSTPALRNNKWHRLSAELPATATTVTLRFVHAQGSPNNPISIAIDDVVVISSGGPVSVSVKVDGTRSAPAPTGKDSRGQTAPNAVSISYDNDGLDSSGLSVLGIATQNKQGQGGLGGFDGIGRRHTRCTRNFQSKGKISLFECMQACVVKGAATCTMLSWGSMGRNPNYKPQDQNNRESEFLDTECRISLSAQGCSPENTYDKTNLNPVSDSIPNVPTLYPTATTLSKVRAHGSLGSRVDAHVLQPVVGGIFVGSTGYQNSAATGGTTTAVTQVQDSSDLLMNVGKKVTVTLDTPTLMRKVIVRQPSPTSAITPRACLAKKVQFTFPDGTLSFVVFDEEKEDTYLTKERGDTGGAYGAQKVTPISSMFGLPVTESYTVQVLSTQGKCPANKKTTVRGLEVRGHMLSNVALQGAHYQRCDTKSLLGTYRDHKASYGCKNVFDGGSTGNNDEGHAWITDGLGPGASLTTNFDSKQTLYAVSLRQNARHKAKQIRWTFHGQSVVPPMTKMLQNKDEKMQIFAIPGDAGVKTSSVTLEILSTYEKYEIPPLSQQGWRLLDAFTTQEFDTTQWSFPSAALRGVESIKYGYDAGKSATPLYFEGHSVGKQPVRSMLRFPTSHTEITVDLERTAECSNQFIVLSTSKKYKFSHGPEDNTIKFVYNCNDKYIYGPKEVTAQKPATDDKNVVGTSCPYQAGSGKERWNLEITEDKVVFAGDRCGPPLILDLTKEKGSFAAKLGGGQFYVYVGASQDRPNQRSYFGRIEVRSWGTGLRDLAYLGKAE